MNGVQEDFSLHHRQKCCNALRIGEVKGVITCHEIHHAFMNVLFWEDEHGHGSNGQYTVGFADDDNRAGEWSCLKKGVGVFCRLTQKQTKKSSQKAKQI